jgi:hypothetical protein
MMNLVVIFKHYKWVSQGDYSCKLEVKFAEGARFRAAVGGKFVLSDTKLKKRLPAMVEPYDLNAVGGGANIGAVGGALGGALGGLFGTTGAANFFVSFGMSNLWSMINGIQIIIHYPMFRINTPGNMGAL